MMMREEQGRNLTQWLHSFAPDSPLILTGDLNAQPSEPVIQALTSHEKDEALISCYDLSSPEKTTFKIRQSGKECKTLDYIFTSPGLETISTLELPAEDQLGAELLPSKNFPSDHLSLLADIMIVKKED